MNKVDFIATVKGGGFTIVKQAEAGAIRLALSKCLACFVDFEVVKEMKVGKFFKLFFQSLRMVWCI